MAEIIPLRGIRYVEEKVGHLDRIMAPPYDVVSPEEQDLLYKKSPYNIIRLEKPRHEPGDTGEERYLRAGDQYRWWLKDGVLKREDKPSLYLYEEGFPGDDGELRVRRGLTCGVKLTPYEERVVLPHEETMEKPKEDRLKLMRACKANISPLFSLYAAKEGEDPLPELLDPFREAAPVISFSDSRGFSHRVWAVDDEAAIGKVAEFFAGRQIFMADGHHRYETALAYHRELGRPAGAAAAYVMMTLVNIYDPGLVVLPTHRLVRGGGSSGDGDFQAGNSLNIKALLSSLEGAFDVEKCSYSTAEEVCGRGLKELERAGADSPAMGLFAGEGQFFLLRYKNGAGIEEHSHFEELDAVLLQELILEKVLGIDAEKRHQGDYLRYTRDCREAVSEVLKGNCQMAFLLNPTPAKAVIRAATAGQKMPQKSTYFYPKLTAGLIINPLD